MRIEIGALTDVGCVRELNEDALRVVPELNLFIISDGMGGQAHGEVASVMAVDAIVAHCRESLKDPSLPLEGDERPELSARTNRLASAVRRANRLIREAANADSALIGMGATVVAIWIDGQKLSLAHVGDSRAYRLRTGAFEQLTRDHSLVAEQVRLGMLTEEQAQHSELQSVLIRALGAIDDVKVDLDEHELSNKDVVLLCSDGLSRMVSDEAIARTIADSRDPQSAANRLIEMAKEAGGLDNITVILVACEQRSPGLLDRLGLRHSR